MGFRFRKSISLGKFGRINVGKKGIGISAGIKGARVGVGSRGAYSSFGIPGTGVSNVTHHGKGSKTAGASQQSPGLALGCAAMLVIVAAIALLFVSPYLSLLLVFVSIFAGAYYQRVRARQNKVGEEIGQPKENN